MKYNNFAEIQKDLYSEKNISDNVKTSNHNSKFLTINFKKGIETIAIRDIKNYIIWLVNYVKVEAYLI
jgi:hypothetical protein